MSNDTHVSQLSLDGARGQNNNFGLQNNGFSPIMSSSSLHHGYSLINVSSLRPHDEDSLTLPESNHGQIAFYSKTKMHKNQTISEEKRKRSTDTHNMSI